MELKLNSQNPEILLQLNSEFSYLLIQSVSITSLKNSEKVKLTAELKYVDEGDERKEEFQIHLITEPRQVEPIFNLNKLITLGKNQEQRFFNRLTLYVENLDENYTLKCNIEKLFGIKILT